MSTFTLTITLGNDAMQSPRDISAALYQASKDVVRGAFPTGIVWDENGNKVGEWSAQ